MNKRRVAVICTEPTINDITFCRYRLCSTNLVAGKHRLRVRNIYSIKTCSKKEMFSIVIHLHSLSRSYRRSLSFLRDLLFLIFFLTLLNFF